MRNLAAALNVQAMSLYYHVRDKEVLLGAMIEAVIGEIELPSPAGDWRTEMERRAISARAALGRHPWAVSLLVSRINTGAAHLSYIDRSLACLLAAGFAPIQADTAINVLDSYIYGHAMIENSFPIGAADIPEMARESVGLISAESHPALEELSRLVIAGKYDGMPKFEEGLRAILMGIEASLARRHR